MNVLTILEDTNITCFHLIHLSDCNYTVHIFQELQEMNA